MSREPLQSSEVTEPLRMGMDRLRGRLFEIVESWGMGRQREDAMKGVIRSTTYDMQLNLEGVMRDASGRD